MSTKEEQKQSELATVNEQTVGIDRDEMHRVVVRKRERGLLISIGIFAVIVAAVAIIGVLLSKEPKTVVQGQADCDVVRVSGKLPGRVVKFYVHEGDYVHKGDTLVSIYSSTVDAKLSQARSMAGAAQSQSRKVDRGTRGEIISSATNVVRQAQAAEEISRKTYERMENLYKEGVISEQKRDEAKAAYDAAQAQVKTAQSQLEMALNGAQAEDRSSSRNIANAAQGSVREVESLLEDQFLLAPCDGEVSEIYPHVGELVSIGTPIMSISVLDDMWVAFNVREEKLNDLTMDKEVKVTIPALGNREAVMRVYYIHDMGSYAVWNATKAYDSYDSKTFEVKMRPVEAVENLRPGMSILLGDAVKTGKDNDKKASSKASKK